MTKHEPSSFRALITREPAPGQFTSSIESRSTDELPPGDVTIDVHYSSVNYKDLLVAAGHRGITRRYPHTPGIDAAGVVVESRDPAFPVGAEAIVIGYDLGMNTAGGFAERIRVPSGWVLRKPEGLDLRAAMQHGTAGLTAALSVGALLETGLRPEMGDVVVTGASGGVGAIAVAMLAKHGFRVVAVSRNADFGPALLTIGAAEVVTPDAVATSGGKPMAKERWAGAVDTVGSELLFELVKALRYGGAVAACGMAGGATFAGNVYPFILRGARLLGVDSVELDRTRKQAALDSLGGVHRIDTLDRIAHEVTLDALAASLRDPKPDAPRALHAFGRSVVRVRGPS